jgi:myo-inositol-1(or 4)-monophosphatase
MWAELLTELADIARARARDAGLAGHTGARNAKGDAVRAFDRAAHEALLARLQEALTQAGQAAEILSEEGAPRIVGTGAPRWCVVLDPVDGSDNAARGLPLSAFSAAVLPAGAPLMPDHVHAAVIAPVEGGLWLLAEGRPRSWQAPALAPSGVTEVREALLSVELNHLAPAGALARLMKQARGVRAYGCCSRALMLVASGALDAHLDIRARLTPESWLAAAALLKAAGGAFALLDEKLRITREAPRDLGARSRIIAAATPALLEAIIAQLHDNGQTS